MNPSSQYPGPPCLHSPSFMQIGPRTAEIQKFDRKFGEDRPKDLGEVGEQTEKKHDQQKKNNNINSTFDLDDL